MGTSKQLFSKKSKGTVQKTLEILIQVRSFFQHLKEKTFTSYSTSATTNSQLPVIWGHIYLLQRDVFEKQNSLI